MHEIQELLNRAREEILSLRRQNEILAAKVGAFELAGALLAAAPERYPERASIDVANDLLRVSCDIQQDIDAGARAAALAASGEPLAA